MTNTEPAPPQGAQGHSDVLVMASLINSIATLQPSPSLRLRMGIIPTSVSAHASSIVSSEFMQTMYNPVSETDRETILQLWQVKSSAADAEVEDEIQEEDLRDVVSDVILSETEWNSLLGLLREAPDNVQFKRVLSLFHKRSSAHQLDVQVERTSAPSRKLDRIFAQNKRRKENEAAKREEEMLRKDWSLQDQTLKESAVRTQRETEQAHRARREAAGSREEAAMRVIASKQAFKDLYPSLIHLRRWEQKREFAEKTAECGEAREVDAAVHNALSAGQDAFAGGPRHLEWVAIAADLQGVAARAHVAAAQKSAERRRVGVPVLDEEAEKAHMLQAEKWLQEQLDNLFTVHAKSPDHPAILQCKDDLASAQQTLKNMLCNK